MRQWLRHNTVGTAKIFGNDFGVGGHEDNNCVRPSFLNEFRYIETAGILGKLYINERNIGLEVIVQILRVLK